MYYIILHMLVAESCVVVVLMLIDSLVFVSVLARLLKMCLW